MTLRELERRAVILDGPRNRLLVDPDDLFAGLPDGIRRDLATASRLGRAAPKAAFGPFRQMVDGAICLANQTAVAGTSEAALFPVAQYSAFAANQLRAGQIWKLTGFGILTTAGATPGNITITPRFGTTTGGTALGASAATALATSGTNVPWRLDYYLIVRTIGNAGANSTCVGNGTFETNPAAVAAATGNGFVFGSTASVSVDSSVAAGLFIGVTLGSASDTMTAMGVILESLN